MAIEDTTQPQALAFYSARRLRANGAPGVVVVLTNAIDDDLDHHADDHHHHPPHYSTNNHINNGDDDEDEDEDDDVGGGGLMVPITHRERVAAIDARHAPYFAALLCVSRTLLCWLVLGPHLVVVAAASASSSQYYYYT